MQNTRNLVERFQALKELERLESAAASPSAGASLTAALLAGHQTRNYPTPITSSRGPLSSRLSPATLSASYLDRALLAADPLLSQSASNSATNSMVDRLAEENLILKRRLLMRESMENARAFSAPAHPTRTAATHLMHRRGVPTTSTLAAQSREALKLMNEQREAERFSRAAPMRASSSLHVRAIEQDSDKPAGNTNTRMAIASEIDNDTTKATESIPGHPELKVPLSSLSFPLKLYRMLEDAEKNGYDDIISFTPDGLSFQVHDREKFVKDIMPKYFKMGQFASFHRQLNCYGFERINRGTEHSAFYHELFQRGNKKVLQRLKRKKQRVPGGDGRTLDDDRAAAIKALMGIHRNAHVLLGNNL